MNVPSNILKAGIVTALRKLLYEEYDVKVDLDRIFFRSLEDWPDKTHSYPHIIKISGDILLRDESVYSIKCVLYGNFLYWTLTK